MGFGDFKLFGQLNPFELNYLLEVPPSDFK